MQKIWKQEALRQAGRNFSSDRAFENGWGIHPAHLGDKAGFYWWSSWYPTHGIGANKHDRAGQAGRRLALIFPNEQ